MPIEHTMEVVKEFLESSTIHGLSHIQSAQVSIVYVVTYTLHDP